MKKSIIYTVFFVSIIFTAPTALAQSADVFHKVAEGQSKYVKNWAKGTASYSKEQRGDGLGLYGRISSKAQYDTIALVTFSVNGHEAYARQMATGNKAWAWVTTEGARQYANGFYKQAIQQMKADFKARGVILLTPDEFLNTPEKKQFYKTFVAKEGAMNKLTKGGIGKGKIKSREAADGFTYIDMAVTAAGFSFINSLGSDLAKGLGVKMVAGVTLSIGPVGPNSKDMKLTEINWKVLGPNAFPRLTGDKRYEKINSNYIGYNEGHLYAQTVFAIGKKGEGAVFDITKRKQNTTTYDGFEKVMALFVKGTLDGFEQAVQTYGTK